MASRRRVVSGVLAAFALTVPVWAEVYVVCDPASGEVLIDERVDENRQVLLEGPLPGERTATIWIDENCPARTCDAAGACVAAGGTVTGGGDGWVAGELTSETLGAPDRENAPGRQSAPGGQRAASPGALAGRASAAGGPPTADLSPLVHNTQAAANGCSYPAALRSVEQIANFDPGHPFYVANRDKIWRLAERQRQTEQTVWQASAALRAGDLNRARELSWGAANIAVSCQAPAVSTLLGGIDTAIKQVREQKDLKRRKAAARLLPGLVSLSNALIGAENGVPVDIDALAVEIGSSVGLDLPLGALDPCAFKYDYGSASSLEPLCSCPGYRFDPGQFRCVR